MTEYSNELISQCKPLFLQGFKSIYDNTCKKCKKRSLLLREFQENLEKINKWNTDIIENEYIRFTKSIKSVKLDDLVKASFINVADDMLLYTKNLDLVQPFDTGIFIFKHGVLSNKRGNSNKLL